MNPKIRVGSVLRIGDRELNFPVWLGGDENAYDLLEYRYGQYIQTSKVFGRTIGETQLSKEQVINLIETLLTKA